MNWQRAPRTKELYAIRAYELRSEHLCSFKAISPCSSYSLFLLAISTRITLDNESVDKNIICETVANKTRKIEHQLYSAYISILQCMRVNEMTNYLHRDKRYTKRIKI